MSQENENNSAIILQEIGMGKYDKKTALEKTATVGSSKGISVDKFFDFLQGNEEVDPGINVGTALAEKLHEEYVWTPGGDKELLANDRFETSLTVALREYDDANEKQNPQKRHKAVEALHTALLPKFTEHHKDDNKKSKILENFVVIDRPVLPKKVSLDFNPLK